MTDPNLTHLYFLLDRSGSMASLRQDTIGGFDTFIAEQRTAPGRCRVTLAQFDNEYEEVYADRDIATVPSLVLVPRGSSALLDALGRLVVTAGERLAEAIDEAMAAVILEEGGSIRAAGALAGLSENAVGPRLARTAPLAAYTAESGRVTAKGVERALYDLERGHVAHDDAARPPLRFRARRSKD